MNRHVLLPVAVLFPDNESCGRSVTLDIDLWVPLVFGVKPDGYHAEFGGFRWTSVACACECVRHRILCAGTILALKKTDQVTYIRRTESHRLSRCAGDGKGFDGRNIRRFRDVLSILTKNFAFFRGRIDVMSSSSVF